jgi:hypothetical protein
VPRGLKSELWKVLSARYCGEPRRCICHLVLVKQTETYHYGPYLMMNQIYLDIACIGSQTAAQVSHAVPCAPLKNSPWLGILQEGSQ